MYVTVLVIGAWIHFVEEHNQSNQEKKLVMVKYYVHYQVVLTHLLQPFYLSKAIGNQLTCVFVDHGLLRKNEGDEVEAVFGPDGNYELNFIRVNAQERYYEKL